MNRIATIADQSVYGSYVLPGDLIVDTLVPDAITKVLKFNGYFMAKSWPGLREGGTIWIDGNKTSAQNLNGLLPTEFIFRNGGQEWTPWLIKSATIRPIPGTQVIGTSLTIHGLSDLKLLGSQPEYPGLQALLNKKFLTGNFGFWMKGLPTGGHNYHICPAIGGKAFVEGIESQGGFSGIRFASAAKDQTAEGELMNFYIHDTILGEGGYFSRTTLPPVPHIKVKIHDGIITRSAAEAFQLQHLTNDSEVYNVTVLNADMARLHGFEEYQDGGAQWLIDSGNSIIRNTIIDGFCSVGINPMGSKEFPAVGGMATLEKVLFSNGSGIGHYLHNSANNGVDWHWKEVYYRAFNFAMAVTGRPVNNYIVSDAHGTDDYFFDHIIHDGSRAKVFEKPESNILVGLVEQKELPAPTYVNSGFTETPDKVMQWHQFYGDYLPISKNPDGSKKQVATQWTTGQIAFDPLDGKFYKCLVSNVSGLLRPAANSNFVLLTWDENGIRRDKGGDINSKQSFVPPDDLRLQLGDYWRKLGMGYLDREDIVDRFVNVGVNGPEEKITTNKGNVYTNPLKN